MEDRVKVSFNQQGLMQTLGATLVAIEHGIVKIECTLNDRLTQQHGFFHAGVMTSLVDVACGYAALTTMPLDKDVLTVEFKINFLKPGKTSKILAIGHVVQSGRTLTVCEGIVLDETGQKVLARMTATMISLDIELPKQ